jgi:hypothetical protein
MEPKDRASRGFMAAAATLLNASGGGDGIAGAGADADYVLSQPGLFSRIMQKFRGN